MLPRHDKRSGNAQYCTRLHKGRPTIPDGWSLIGWHKNAQARTTGKSPRQAPVKKSKGLFVFPRLGGAQECTTMHN
jgi:hypothetical protein